MTRTAIYQIAEKVARQDADGDGGVRVEVAAREERHRKAERQPPFDDVVLGIGIRDAREARVAAVDAHAQVVDLGGRCVEVVERTRHLQRGGVLHLAGGVLLHQHERRGGQRPEQLATADQHHGHEFDAEDRDDRVHAQFVREELSVALGAERFLKEIEVTASLQHP